MRMRMVVASAVLCLAAVHSMSAQDWEPRERWRRRDGFQVRVAKDYYLPADQIVSWPVIVVGGSATINGRIEDDLIVLGGPVRIGPTAQVRGDVVSVGGEVQVADAANVSGEIHDVAVLWPDIRFALHEWLWGIDRGWWAAFTLAGTVFRFTLILLASSLLALVAPAWIRRVEGCVTEAPLAAGFVGLAGELLIGPMLLVTTLGLVLTIIGIPLLTLLPFVLLALLVTWLAGFAGVAAQIGGQVRQRFGLGGYDSAIADVVWGVLLLFLTTFIGNLFAFAPSFLWPVASSFGIAGFVVEYLAWTVGLGAALLAPLDRRWRTSPPPVPSAARA